MNGREIKESFKDISRNQIISNFSLVRCSKQRIMDCFHINDIKDLLEVNDLSFMEGKRIGVGKGYSAHHILKQ